MINECYNHNLISYDSKEGYHRIRMVTNPIIHDEKDASKDEIGEISGILAQEYYNYMNEYGGIKLLILLHCW